MQKQTLIAAMAAGLLISASALSAEPITVEDAYARAASPAAKTGAAFMMITNSGETEDRLISVRSDVAERVELHTHIAEDGIMRMIHVEEGFPLGAGQSLMLERGGKHVMLMGLKRPLVHGEDVDVTLVFEEAGEIAIEVPIDLERKPEGHGAAAHSEMN